MKKILPFIFTLHSYIALIFCTLLSVNLVAQTDTTSTASQRTHFLRELNVIDYRSRLTESLPEVRGTYLFAGKRSEVLTLRNMDANIADKNGRQLFARVPGVFVYDMDGTGNQLNIATRGLDPHRSWEMNVRQNGVITNSDMYGYPASHYSAPMESISQIELVRGTASLQYGAQFGGMLNYVTKQADTTRKISLESINSVGSYGLLSSYNAVGGRARKWTYYVYHYNRQSAGYRNSGRSTANAQLASIQFQATKTLALKAEVGRSAYIYKIPGPLTDSMFHQNPKQATRERNFFNPDIWVPSVHFDWKISDRTRLTIVNSAVLGNRNSVQFDALAHIKDVVHPETGQFKPRQVDIDGFKSLTSELRILHQYELFGVLSTLTSGIQIMRNDLHRRQLGQGTTGSDFDLTVTKPFGRNLHYKTKNAAFFIENQLRLTSKLTVSPGLRIENGITRMSGTISYYQPENVPNKIRHQFVLLGINGQYNIHQDLQLYGGWSQAYRPVLFRDIVPASIYEKADDKLKDASGYNSEIGLKGSYKGFHFNVGLFNLVYRNRMGNLVVGDENGQTQILRTNVGNSRNKGVEVLIEGPLANFGKLQMTWFSSTSHMDARYRNAQISAGKENKRIDGNKVESAPDWTSRNGVTAAYSTFRFTIQYSYVSQTFSDALNTSVPQATGAKGTVPSYNLWDLNASWQITSGISARMSVNNLLDKSYFTKRPTSYPGPGIWPSDGRTAVISLAINI
ncbi:TonB-dependent receptor [Dyadobacter sp. CY107]|uniref:TonB-dependent receptor family protein n=1 Tax=Dyadobacter fanqingshengii TaxID=2906443 RepID=UPI001F191CF8|nr:TonB-dependent receptor [Dyadobacter fanqingshengii]MCF2505182.1 TonB-dependent receptor [Dyadobacter fanqingshengii]